MVRTHHILVTNTKLLTSKIVHAIVFIVSMADFDKSDPHEPSVNRFVSENYYLSTHS